MIVTGPRLQLVERAKRLKLVATPFTFRDDDVFAADRFEEMDHSDEVSKQPPLWTVRAQDVLAQIGLNFIANKNPSLLATRSLLLLASTRVSSRALLLDHTPGPPARLERVRCPVGRP